MAKAVTFKVSKRDSQATAEPTFMAPENIEDPRWEELRCSRQDINDLAVQSLIIKIQGGARNYLEDGADAVQEYVNEYTYRGGARRVVVSKPKLSAAAAQKGRFTPAQLELLRAAGVEIDTGEEVGATED